VTSAVVYFFAFEPALSKPYPNETTAMNNLLIPKKYAPELILLMLIVLFRISLPFVIPFGDIVEHGIQGLNDEPAHHNYVAYLLKHRSFAVQTHSAREPGAFERADFEYHQPPLYYMLTAGAEVLLGVGGNPLAGRLLAALFGIACVVTLWQVLRTMGFSREACGLIAGMWGFSFNHAYFSSLVSNDSMSWLWAVLVSGQLLGLTERKEWNRKDVLITGIVLGSGFLIKSSLLLFVPVVGMVGLMALLRTRSYGPLIRVMGIGAIAAAIAGPWYVRNLIVYGSITNMEMANGAVVHNLWEPTTLVLFLKSAINCFWVPVTNIEAGMIRSVLNGLGALVLAALFFNFVRTWLRKRSFTAQGVLLTTLFLINGAAYLSYNLHWTMADGRFLYPSLIPLSLLLYMPLANGRDGASAVGKKWVRIALFAALTLFPYLFLLGSINHTALS
jgi:4-amino-4-deoxy-L-arabinose transferase-like glycosyltransferase